MSLADRINAANGRVIHGAWIQGCKYLFRSASLVSPAGTSWTAPKCAINTSRSYTHLDVLDDTGGIDAHPEEWTPLEGVTKGGGLTLRLRATATAIELFGSEDEDINSTLLTADLDYDSGSDTVEVEDTSAFTLPGEIHIGHEAMYVPNTGDATHFGSGDVERGLWAWHTDDRIDTPHKHNLDSPTDLPEQVTDRITSWPGRRVIVFQWLCSQNGRALDAAYRGDNEIEIWSGWIDRLDFAGTHFVLSCKSLAQSPLESEIGRDAVKAYIGGDTSESVYVAPGEAIISWVALGYNGAAYNIGPLRITADGSQNSPTIDGLYTLRELHRYLAQTLESAIQAKITALSGTETVIVEAARSVYTRDDGTNGWRGWLLFYFDGAFTNAYTLSAQVGPIGAKIGLDEFGPVQCNTSSRETAGQVAHDYPPYTVIGEADTTLRCYDDPERESDFPDGPGYAVIEYTAPDGTPQGEVIAYETKTDVSTANGTFTLTGVRRGLFNTFAGRYDVPTGYSGTGPTLTSAWGFEDDDWTGTVWKILTSTGVSPYDGLPSYAGLGLSPACVDLGGMTALAGGPLASYCGTKPIKVGDLIGKLALVYGAIFGGRTGPDGRFRLSLTPVPNLSSVGALSLSTADDGGIVGEPPRMRTAATAINAVRVSSGVDPLTGDYRDRPVTLRNVSGRQRRPDGETADIEVPGIVAVDRMEVGRAVAERLFWAWGEQRPLVELGADRRALLLSPGRVVLVTATGILTPYGERGLTAKPCVIVSMQKHWFRPGAGAAVELTLAALGRMTVINRGLAPTFNVTVSGTTVTVANNVYTLASQTPPWDGYTVCRDWMSGPGPLDEPMELTFWAEGAYASRLTREVDYSADGEWTIGSALAIVPNRAEFTPWAPANRSALQDEWVHVADTSGHLNGVDSTFRWTP